MYNKIPRKHQRTFVLRKSKYSLLDTPVFRVETTNRTSNGYSLAMFHDFKTANDFATKFGGDVKPATTIENRTFLHDFLPDVITDVFYKAKTSFRTFIAKYQLHSLDDALTYESQQGGVLFSEVRVTARTGLVNFVYLKQPIAKAKGVTVTDPSLELKVDGISARDWKGYATGNYVVVTEASADEAWRKEQKEISYALS